MDQNLCLLGITFCKQLLRFVDDVTERMVKHLKYGVDLIWQNLRNFANLAKFTPPQKFVRIRYIILKLQLKHNLCGTFSRVESSTRPASHKIQLM